jgi:isopenicillin-N epimerase
MSAADWTDARSNMLLDPSVTYLNTSSFGPLACSVFERAVHLRHQLATQPTDFMLRAVPALMWRARERVADYLGGAPDRLLFTSNVSSAISMVASSLSLASPGEILLTDHEYNTARWCWERTASRLGLTLRICVLPPTFAPGEIVDLVARAMSPATRLFFFSHILATTGAILPARALCALARERGIVTVVDGAHAPGFIDLRLADIDCDFYVSCGHKWLLMPTGSGFLYLGRSNEERIEPLTVSWGYQRPEGAALDERDQFGSTPRLRRLECEGTRDICPWLLAPEAIAFQEQFGHSNIRARMRELAAYATVRLTDLGAMSAATPQAPGQFGGIAAFYLPEGVDPSALRQALWNRYKIELSVTSLAGRAILRVSTHFYNTVAEIELLATALEELLAGRMLAHGNGRL